VLRSRLGPTLYFTELQGPSADRPKRLLDLIGSGRAFAAQQYGLDPNRKWILHPGLLTPGKGVNFLGKLGPSVNSGVQLIVMGGRGPKARDREFAEATTKQLQALFGERFTIMIHQVTIRFVKC
jgi:hypothetical protein